MKKIEFSEEQLADLRIIAQQLLNDENDPRSNAYKRILVRPKIKWKRAMSWVICVCVIAIGILLLLKTNGVKSIWAILVSLLFVSVVLLVNTKKIIVFLICIYQKYAPDSIRNKCRFEPSCSEYMIIALEKYGVLLGLKKGIDRLKRCNVNDGGYDYP